MPGPATASCEEKGLPVHKTGKVIVAKTAKDLPALDVLYGRAVANGTPIRKIDAEELAELEPLARTAGGQALFSLETAAVESKSILESLKKDLLRSGSVTFLTVQPSCARKAAAAS